jgi:hypothetical protein
MTYSVAPLTIGVHSGDVYHITGTITDQDTVINGTQTLEVGFYHTEWLEGEDVDHLNAYPVGDYTVARGPGGQNTFNFTFTAAPTDHVIVTYLYMYPHDFGSASSAHNSSVISDGLGNMQKVTVTTSPSTGGGGGTGGG